MRRIESLSKLVSFIWQHPLLTKYTETDRTRAREYLTERYGDEQGILFVPVGSSVWITDQSSDVDFLVLYDFNIDSERVAEIKTELEKKRSTDLDEVSSAQIRKDPVIHYAGDHMLNDRFTFEDDISSIALLFLTPDEYIVGDKHYLWQIRHKAMQESRYVFNLPVHQKEFSSSFVHEIYLSLHKICKWPTKSFANEFGSHFNRFLHALSTRAQETNDPIRYMDTFYNSLSELAPPDYETIHRELTDSNGVIHLDQRYFSQNLIIE